MKNKYIATLPNEVQASIEKDLRAQGLNGEDIQTGMNGKLQDLEDTIDINKY